MKRHTSKIIAVIIGCILTILLVALGSGGVGISADSIEPDARKQQNIDRKWEVSMSTSRKFSAMIFYNDTLDNYVYSIYVNRNGLSWGYFFWEGGANVDMVNSVHVFAYDDQDSALISMNKDKVAKIEFDRGDGGVKTIDVNPERPFAVVLPDNPGLITLYDAEGAVIPSIYQ